MPQTIWLGSKKFAIPSFTAYSCPQFPHTNLPLKIDVSMSKVCKSFAVCEGSPSDVINSSGSGVSAGKFGSPS
jgi:hypothetical protein